MIGPEVVILTMKHIHDNVRMPMFNKGVSITKVVIENDVWFGTRVIILSGVTMREGSIVGPGAVVTKDVLPFSIVGGVPAKLIKMRKQK